VFVRKFPEAYALPPRRSLLLSSMIPYLYADLPFIRVHQRAPWDTAPYVALMKMDPFLSVLHRLLVSICTLLC